MAQHAHPTQTCAVCGKAKPARQMLPASVVRPALSDLIQESVPAWGPESAICVSCLNRFRTDFVRREMEKERGELTALEQDVVAAIHDNETDRRQHQPSNSTVSSPSASASRTGWPSSAAAGSSSSCSSP